MFTSRIIDANGLRMHMLEEGEGPAILLAHGFPETAYAWRHQLAGLAAAGFHVVAPDMRGYGKTQAPAEAGRYTVHDIVGDVIGLLDALEIGSALIAGNDWGTTVAWQAALMRPDRIAGVAAIGVPMIGRSPVPPTAIFPQTPEALFYTLYFQAPGVAEAELERDVRTTLLKILFAASRDAGLRRDGDGTPNPFGMVSRQDGMLAALPLPAQVPAWLSPDALQNFVDAFAASGFRGGLNYYRNLDTNWYLQRAHEGQSVAVPALYMVGEQDVGLAMPGMRDIIAAMPALVPRLSRSIFIPGCGHWAPQERPGVVNEILIEFARSVLG